jgi:T-complex protein 1 subunit eta
LDHLQQVGDGTTSVILLASSFLKAAKPFIEEGVSPQVIIRAFHQACSKSREFIDTMKVSMEDKSPAYSFLPSLIFLHLSSFLVRSSNCSFVSRPPQ